MNIFNKITNWYFNKKSLPYWCIFILDNVVVAFSYLLIFVLFNSGARALGVLEYLTVSILAFTALYAIGFKLFHTYDGILRYSSFVDLQRVGLAVMFGTACSLLAQFLVNMYNPYAYIGPLIITLASIIAVLLLWTTRILIKIVYDVSDINRNSKYAFIYGVRGGGIGIAKRIRNEKPIKFILKGFVSDEEGNQPRYLMGNKVYRLDESLVPAMKKKGIEAFIVSPFKIDDFRKNESLQNALINAGITILITPQVKEWTDSEENTRLKEISIEDLLPRDEIQVDMDAIEALLRGKRIMVTGSAGSIGSEIVRQIAKFGPESLILIDQAETPQHDIRLLMQKEYPEVKAETIVASICNGSRMEAVFKEHRPDYVFHAAAYKHVPMMEDNPCEAVQNNVEGTKTIASLAVKYGVRKFVMISTDKAVNPTNVMGCSKRICEIYVQSLDKAIKDGKVRGVTQFVTTRFGNVLGSNGSVIPLFKEQIRNGGPVTVTHPDIFRYFMLIPEACKLVLEAGTMGNGGEIFVFDMGAPVKIADLARRMIRLSGANGVEIKYTGLRDGEKLYEEVLNDKEVTKPTFNSKIKIAKVREYDFNETEKAISALVEDSYRYDIMSTVREMKRIVPEYKSNHSVYEALDRQ